MTKQRTYMCIDMKSFFASVECAERGLNPFETNLIVADETRGDGTICLAVTPKMKSLGVKNRCRRYEIPKNIRYLVAKPRMQKYIDYAAEIYGIYLDYMDKQIRFWLKTKICALPPEVDWVVKYRVWQEKEAKAREDYND